MCMLNFNIFMFFVTELPAEEGKWNVQQVMANAI